MENKTKQLNLLNNDIDFLKDICLNRIQEINKKIESIRNLKGYKGRLISNKFKDYESCLKDLAFLDYEYKRILRIFNINDYETSLLNETEINNIRRKSWNIWGI